jgi:8-oxo-dGTP pyrophosphatase MutT (NUDIX family)
VTIDADLIARTRLRADLPPALPRVPLQAGPDGTPIGSLEPALAQALASAGVSLRDAGAHWRLLGDIDAELAHAARWIHAQRLGGRWRDELLPVIALDAGATGEPVALGVVERAAVRPLGIATHAVHLVGRSAGGAWWVQQRALDKATDPGLWDTLVGGLVSAAESIRQTLERETWEEAGLHIEALRGVAALGRCTVRRPVADGYMVEHMHLFEAVLPDNVEPVNQDGEVARFECLSEHTLRQRLLDDAFTVEAALLLVLALQHWGRTGG